jgi:2-oxoglutarate ferredoxin oxidoreductase subunit gamma
MSTTELRVSGFGGQGVILCAYIIGRAAALHDQKHATLTQSFGPEARGSACSAQVILSDEPVLYPYVHHPDVLVCMSQEAYTRFEPEVEPDGIILYEVELVSPRPARDKMKVLGVPATRIAEELGRTIMVNIVMLGFFTAVTGLLPREAARRAVEESVPEGTQKPNLAAFDRGYEYGMKLVSEGVAAKV